MVDLYRAYYPPVVIPRPPIERLGPGLSLKYSLGTSRPNEPKANYFYGLPQNLILLQSCYSNLISMSTLFLRGQKPTDKCRRQFLQNGRLALRFIVFRKFHCSADMHIKLITRHDNTLSVVNYVCGNRLFALKQSPLDIPPIGHTSPRYLPRARTDKLYIASGKSGTNSVSGITLTNTNI